MAVLHLLLHIIVLLLCLIKVSSNRNYSCPSSCNPTATVLDIDKSILYPFGIGEGCYFDKPLLASSKAEIIVIPCYISPTSSQSMMDFTVTFNISVITNGNKTNTLKGVDLSDKSFPVSNDSNWIAVIGWDNYDTINQSTKELVNADDGFPTLSCDPTQTAGCYEFICSFPLDRKFYGGNISAPHGCKSAFFVERRWLQPTDGLRRPSEVSKDGDNVPVPLKWGKSWGKCLELYSSHDTIFCQKGRYTESCSIKLSSNLVCQCSGLSHKGCEGHTYAGWSTFYALLLSVVGVFCLATLLIVAARATMVTWITVLVLLALAGNRRGALARQGRKITTDVATYLLKGCF